MVIGPLVVLNHQPAAFLITPQVSLGRGAESVRPDVGGNVTVAIVCVYPDQAVSHYPSTEHHLLISPSLAILPKNSGAVAWPARLMPSRFTTAARVNQRIFISTLRLQ